MKSSKIGGIAAVLGTVAGIFLMFKVWAVLGMIVYMITFGLSLHELRQQVSYEETFNIFTFLRRINKETFWQEGVFAIVVAIIPIIVGVFLYTWIVLDSVRSADFMMNRLF